MGINGKEMADIQYCALKYILNTFGLFIVTSSGISALAECSQMLLKMGNFMPNNGLYS